MDKKNTSKKENKKDKKSLIIIILLLLIIGLISYFGFFAKSDTDDTLAVDQTQSEYVKPENPVDRSKNVSLPGWGSFTIPANTKKIDKGFEFHNPDTNFWYEDSIQYNGKELEKLVVDSGNKVELNHFLKLAGINSEVKSVKSYNKKLFNIDKNDDENYQLEAVGYTDKDSKIVVETKAGKKVELTVKCTSNLYYMQFSLYLKDGDELLYQSGLVAPGKYIQEMDISKELKAGSYDAYVVCQPYRSDKKTKTNTGVVNMTLNVQ